MSAADVAWPSVLTTLLVDVNPCTMASVELTAASLVEDLSTAAGLCELVAASLVEVGLCTAVVL